MRMAEYVCLDVCVVECVNIGVCVEGAEGIACTGVDIVVSM